MWYDENVIAMFVNLLLVDMWRQMYNCYEKKYQCGDHAALMIIDYQTINIILSNHL